MSEKWSVFGYGVKDSFHSGDYTFYNSHLFC